MRGLRLVTCLFAALLSFASAGRADDFDLPGVSGDARAYETGLTKRFPAGGSQQARRQAEQQASAAFQKQDWAGTITALEQRVALGDAVAVHWMGLATAYLRRTPADAQKALLAGWRYFEEAGGAEEEVPALLLVAEALGKLDRPVQVIQTLEAIVERAPDKAEYKTRLADTRKAVGVMVR